MMIAARMSRTQKTTNSSAIVNPALILQEPTVIMLQLTAGWTSGQESLTIAF